MRGRSSFPNAATRRTAFFLPWLRRVGPMCSSRATMIFSSCEGRRDSHWRLRSNIGHVSCRRSPPSVIHKKKHGYLSPPIHKGESTPMVTIDDIAAPTPRYDEVAVEYRVLERDLSAAANGEAAAEVVHRWDALRRQIDTWSNLVNLRFSQDTTREQFRKDREYCDEITPRLTDLDVGGK